jgi:hypothetical protein
MDSQDETPKPAHKVGYKNPPLHSRYKSPISGNPRGRPKGPKTLAGIIKRVLSTKVTVTASGKRKRMNALEAVATRTLHDALAGDRRAGRDILKLAQLAEPAGPTEADIARQLAAAAETPENIAAIFQLAACEEVCRMLASFGLVKFDDEGFPVICRDELGKLYDLSNFEDRYRRKEQAAERIANLLNPPSEAGDSEG